MTCRVEVCKVCNFCHKKQHWKAVCYALQAKSKQNRAAAKGACLAVSMPNLLAREP